MLNWLREQVSALWRKIKTIASDAWNWAVQEANKALNSAKAWARNAVNTAKITIRGWVEAAKQLASNLFAAAMNFANNVWLRAVAAAQALVAGVTALAQALFGRAVAAAQALVQGVVVLAQWLFGRAVATAQALVNGVLAVALALFNKAVATAQAIVFGVRNVILAIIARVEAWVLEQLVSMGVDVPGGKQMLKAFLDSPLNFILAAVIPYFMSILEWSLAYALGTKDRDLPPWPDFVGEGAGGGIYPGEGPPPGASGLAPPLDSIRISGYTYRPGHPGIDLGLVIGANIYAMHDGEVIYAGWDNRVYGYQVTIKSGEWWSLYGHCSQLLVAPGQRVNQRSTIALGGTSGNSSGPHLHLEIKYEGRYIDPITVL